MSDFESMMRDFRANAQRYDFERAQEMVGIGIDDAFQAERIRAARVVESDVTAHAIAEIHARGDLLCIAVQVGKPGAYWLDTQHATISAEEADLLAVAVRYLDLRGMLDRHPHSSHLVRIKGAHP